MMRLSVDLFGLILFGFIKLHDCVIYTLYQIWVIFFKYIFNSTLFLLSYKSFDTNVGSSKFPEALLIFSNRFFFLLFGLSNFCRSVSRFPNLSSVFSIPLLSPSTERFISTTGFLSSTISLWFFYLPSLLLFICFKTTR